MNILSLVLIVGSSLIAVAVFIQAAIKAPDGMEDESGFVAKPVNKFKATQLDHNFRLSSRLLKSDGNGITPAHG